MRRIRGLQTTPAEYAKAVADYQSNRPPEQWDWNDFREEYRDAVVLLKKGLLAAQHGLCAYCENRLAPGEDLRQFQVEHVLPKGSKGQHPQRHLDERNMVAACLGGTNPAQYFRPGGQELYAPGLLPKDNHCCGQTKKEDEAVDPRLFPLMPRLFRLEDSTGRIYLDRGRCTSWSNERMDTVERCIDKVLNLNCRRLCDLRKRRIEDYSRLVEAIPQTATEAQIEALLSDSLAPNQGGILREFWTTVHYALGERAERWLASHAHLFM